MALQHKSEGSLGPEQEEGKRRWAEQQSGISTVTETSEPSCAQQTFSSHSPILLRDDRAYYKFIRIFHKAYHLLQNYMCMCHTGVKA